jgi:hypothetical protein
MYAHLNTTEKLTVRACNYKRFRFVYQIVNKQTGAVLHTHYSNRKFIAATLGGDHFSSLDRVNAFKDKMFDKWVHACLIETYFCYLEDTSAFEPENMSLGPKLAYSLTNKYIDNVKQG